MARDRTFGSLLVIVLALVLSACGGDDDEGDEAAPPTTAEETGGGGTTLNGSVGPGFTISLDGTEGLSAGGYTIVVNDQSSSHNFHLTGPGGVDVATDVSGEGEETFEVQLEPGEYTFVCDPHAAQMTGSFTVS